MKFYELNESIINVLVPKESTGTYLLGNKIGNNFFIKYTGRSDLRLKKRLIDHAKSRKYTYFSFFLTETIQRAYEIECREWHNAIDLDNKIHPRKPKNLDYKCPYCCKKNGGFKLWKI